MPVHISGAMSGNACISGRKSCDDACLYHETVLQTNLDMKQNQRSKKEQVATL